MRRGPPRTWFDANIAANMLGEAASAPGPWAGSAGTEEFRVIWTAEVLMDAVLPYRAMAYNNGWANHRLLTACVRLSQADFVAPRTGFFPSLRATLNHILIVDCFWRAAHLVLQPGLTPSLAKLQSCSEMRRGR